MAASDAMPGDTRLKLDDVEVRVLGALVEKEITTPEYYPLTLIALVNACNQKNNRYPETAYDEATVRSALERLRVKRLAIETTGAGHRVPKYSQRVTEVLNLGRREQALLCELMVRGPQTAGELHSRAQRMHAFSDLAEVESTLRRLAGDEPQPLVAELARQPGTKESRFTHLLSGEAPSVPQLRRASSNLPEAAGAAMRAGEAAVAALEREVHTLRVEIEELKQQFADFRRQFE